MIRGFYSGASGMISQQEKLNVIGNNMANISTNGFKAKNTQFTGLIYKNLNGALPPISTGHGVRVVDNATDFAQSSPKRTDIDTDFAIIGDAFFAVENPADGEIYYTRDGAFRYSVEDEGETKYLVDAHGKYVLNVEGERINITELEEAATEEEPFSLKNAIGLYTFANNFGLENIGNNLFKANDISGEAEPFILEDVAGEFEEGEEPPEIPKILSGFVESSNVDIAEQMVKMIEASRAFSFNARVVSVTDELEQTVNQLRR